ncbi:MAG TPA: hypothetical protein VK508_03775 [Cyclobacteriaceae bacterium]|nr:hypothetical protein [Cyclobacteriaceae bacterium]
MAVRRIFLLLICTIVLSLWQTVVFGQPGDPPNPDDVPITGLEYLLGGGVLYGIRSLLKGRKKNQND